ncbi:MAG: hypothetical protein JKY93_04640 [Gammaproteobacteria bacterium]|nr:hypothetical protein [Gammaproteobacteria bacterium]
MLEYIFFHEKPRDLFTAYLSKHEIPYQLGDDETGYLVSTTGDLDDDTTHQLEDYYEQMMALNESSRAAKKATIATNAIQVRLKNGESMLVDVPEQLVKKVLGVISINELDGLVNAIVDCVENPN